MDINNEYGCLEMQKALFPILKEFDNFCNERGIRYSLDGGTLLGAIRHKGFIPWDDDVDVFMDRRNYEKLKVEIKGYNKLSFDEYSRQALWTPRVRLHENIDGFGYPPTLDIFIKDFVPKNPIVAKMKDIAILGCQGMIKSKLQLKKGNFVLKLCSLVTFFAGRLFTEKSKFKMYGWVSQIGDSKKATQVCGYNTMWNYIRFKFNRTIIDNYMIVPFEDTELSVTAEYHHYLSVLYGDYMKPPKMEHRLAKHINNAYDIADMYVNGISLNL